MLTYRGTAPAAEHEPDTELAAVPVYAWYIISSWLYQTANANVAWASIFYFEKRGEQIVVVFRRFRFMSELTTTNTIDLYEQRFTDIMFLTPNIWTNCTIPLYRICNMFKKKSAAKKQKVLALAMGAHVRLGANSLLRLLSADSVRLIAAQVSPALFALCAPDNERRGHYLA